MRMVEIAEEQAKTKYFLCLRDTCQYFKFLVNYLFYSIVIVEF